MDNLEIFNAINKGIPNYISIEININTLIEQCAENSIQLKNEFTLISKLFNEHIIRTNNYTKAKEDFFTSFRTYTSYKTAETNIYISPTNYLERLKEILNISNPSIDFNDLELKQEMLDKIEQLKRITSPKKLKQEFPEIYKDFELAQDAYPKIKNYEEKNRNTHDLTKLEKLDRQKKLYKTYALDTRFNIFIKKQALMYRNMIVRRQFIEGYANNNKIDLRMFTGLNKEKFELYLADKYMTIAQNTNEDSIKQECVYFLCTYIRETKFNQVSIKNDEGKEVTFRKILTRFKKLLRENPILKPIDEDRCNFRGYHIKHVENHVKKYFISGINWQILPPGDEVKLNTKVIEALNQKYNYLSLEEKEKLIIQRYKEYERKINFFEKSNYIYRIYGINELNGYIAYIYPNGEIMMEKFFNDYANCIPTINEAIYNLKVTDFENLSKLKKSSLIKNKRCYRIIHKGKWEDKGQEIIDRPTTIESQEQVKQLILKLQK